ncbi:hypothetical protein PFY12_13675 [Chryseobacterium camelliae]|uniref:DUF8188 domain-containing protein n=1 Tax=Chryseobacterium camelliae TaxID=1265445 RepID=A0ABY7QM40_9FLAO|nr:hypothetical protein [Chryseobacterium camelliae]WBV60081.1 hypothetical protein PFY12_13675 [Chryseobacterium camelliae]
MKNQFLQVIGYAIGVLVLVPLAIYLINIFFFKSPIVTDKEINRFIDNSINTEIVVWFDRPLTISEKHLGRHSKTASTFLSRNGSGNYNYTSYTFYDKASKKYFSLLQLVESGYIFRNIKQADILNIKINKYFLKNEDYGTLQNPIPILYYAGIEEAIRTPKVQTQFKEGVLSAEEQFGIDKNNDFDLVYMERVYKASVFKYLTFIIPRKDYKKMFPK